MSESAERSESKQPPGEPPLQPRNFWAWVGYQFFYRVGWQFKMESTLIAGLISWLSESPVVRGNLIALNSVSRCLAPLLAAPLIDAQPSKRRALLVAWICTAAAWAVLALFLWTPAAGERGVTLWVFAACYALFFVFLGAVNVAQGTLLGKIIPAPYRGRAMAAGMGLSGIVNVGLLFLTFALVSGARFPEPRNYALAFSLAVGIFALAALSLLFVDEQPSPGAPRRLGVRAGLKHALELARRDPNLRRLLWINLTVWVGGNLLQFYTGYWRDAGGLTPGALLLATIGQTAAQALSSAWAGRAADRRGNRALIYGCLWVEASVPLTAILMGTLFGGGAWFLVVFVLVGVRFPVYQLLVNYLLEALPPEEHAIGLGVVNAVQIAASPAPVIFGLLVFGIERVAPGFGYPTCFVLTSAIVVWGTLLVPGLREPRFERR